MQNIDFRYTSADGAQWRERGADTWNPFSSMAPFVQGGQTSSNPSITTNIGYMNSDGVYKKLNTTSPSACVAFIGDSSEIASAELYNNSYRFICKKAGWYKNGNHVGIADPFYCNVGDVLMTVPPNSYGSYMAVYLGDSITIE